MSRMPSCNFVVSYLIDASELPIERRPQARKAFAMADADGIVDGLERLRDRALADSLEDTETGLTTC